MSSLEKMIGVLDLFEERSSTWTFDQLVEELGYTRSTLYRYLKVLTDAGLLVSLPDIGYTLGPRIAELDYQMRMHDALVIASRPLMTELVHEFPSIGLLCRRYRLKVLCVHQEIGTDAIRSNYERGLARPLVRGAASQIILAYLPTQTLTKLYQSQAQPFSDVGLGEDLPGVKQSLKRIRQRGWCMTKGQVTAGVIGIAAPVLDSRGTILGSLSLTLPGNSSNEERSAVIADRLMFCARVVTNAISR